jgi:arylsulfatase A-like enzyme
MIRSRTRFLNDFERQDWRQIALDVVFSGAGGGAVVAAFLVLVAMVWYRADLWARSSSVLGTFAWMFVHYLMATVAAGLFVSSLVHLLLRKSPLRRRISLPVVIAALLSIAALVDAGVTSHVGARHTAVTWLSGAVVGISAAIGVGVAILWLKRHPSGNWLLSAGVVMIPVTMIITVLSIEMRRHVAAQSQQQLWISVIYLGGVVFASAAAVVFGRLSQRGKLIGSVLFALGCAALVTVPLSLGSRKAVASPEFTGTAPDASGPSSGGSGTPNVLLISIDTLRADRLSCYGNRRLTSPAIDGIASAGVVFRRAYSTSSWTLPAHASMLTGMYSASHGADMSLNLSEAERFDPLSPGVPTLAEKLRERGYRTAGFVSNPWVGSTFGLARGFNEYHERLDRYPQFIGMTDSLLCRSMAALGICSARDYDGELRVDEFLPDVLEWLRKRSESPFFLFLHFMEPHTPYDPPEKYRLDASGRPIPIFREFDLLMSGKFSLPPARQTEVDRLYEGEISCLDDKLSELFGLLDHLGLTQNTLVIITSDHGESLGEHGLWTHGNSLYEEQVHVPLIMRLPGIIPAGRVIEYKLASLVDVVPSVLDLTGTPPALGVQGLSLRAAWESGTDRPLRAVFAELRPSVGWRRTNPDLGRGLRMIRTIDAHYIEGNDGPRELYRTAEDRLEEHNVIKTEPTLAQSLETALHGWQARTGPEGPVNRLNLTPETVKQLKALGYIR